MADVGAVGSSIGAYSGIIAKKNEESVIDKPIQAKPPLFEGAAPKDNTAVSSNFGALGAVLGGAQPKQDSSIVMQDSVLTKLGNSEGLLKDILGDSPPTVLPEGALVKPGALEENDGRSEGIQSKPFLTATRPDIKPRDGVVKPPSTEAKPVEVESKALAAPAKNGSLGYIGSVSESKPLPRTIGTTGSIVQE